MMNNTPLTIIILTDKNDNRFITALTSAQFAQEVLIVDNNSQNDWKALGRKLKFTVVKKVEHVKDFSRVRNEAIAFARSEWILFLDSDEEIQQKDQSEISRLLKKSSNHGYYFYRKDYFLGKPLNFGETGRIKTLRLFRKGKGVFVRKVHEVSQVSGKVANSRITLLHNPHNSISEFLMKIDKYSQLESLAVRSENRSTLLFKLFFFPPLKFVQNYFIKLGFLDGIRGFIYALMMSFHSFFVRIHQYEKNNNT